MKAFVVVMYNCIRITYFLDIRYIFALLLCDVYSECYDLGFLSCRFPLLFSYPMAEVHCGKEIVGHGTALHSGNLGKLGEKKQSGA